MNIGRNMPIFPIVITILIVFVYNNEASKILVVFPLPGVSHGILGNSYVETLLNVGHEVTYITPYPRKDAPPNLHQIVLSYPEEILPGNFFKLDAILNKEIDVHDFSSMFSFFYELTEHFLKHENVQRLITDPEQHFDLVIIEWLFTEIYAGFAAVFQSPLVWSSSMDPHWMVLRLVDEMPNPAYVADIMSTNVPPFTFTQRVQELWVQMKMSFLLSLNLSKYNSLYEDIFVAAGKKKGIVVPSLYEVKFNASFVLSNSHVSLGEPVKLPQNYIPIGGYHIDPEPKPLPEDLKNIMDKAKDGVIYFSMGSNLKSKDMPDKLKRELLEMFGQLKQTVLWKFEETLPDLPKNVHMLKWAPQQSILGHPNCLLFITHGGLLSTTETVHFGVPTIGIPVFADQFINVGRAVKKGFAKKVDFSYDTPKELKAAIHELLSDPSYHERVKKLSLIYHDRPITPRKALVHYVEHAIKTRGALHFRSRALQVSWYQKMYLDLAALVAGTFLSLYFFLRYMCKSTKQNNSRKKLE